MRWCYLGRVEYRETLDLQLALRAAILDGRAEDTLLLVEHEPVITLGRSAEASNVLADEASLARLGVQRVDIGRGGDVTYHGPGQLVGYPVRHVGRAIRRHVNAMSDVIVEYLGGHGLDATWSDDMPGVWVDGAKIAAVGVDARRRVAIHGFALNLAPNLAHFELIVPCGLRRPVTSVAAQSGSAPTVAEAAPQLARMLCVAYGSDAQQVDRSALEGGL